MTNHYNCCTGENLEKLLAGRTPTGISDELSVKVITDKLIHFSKNTMEHFFVAAEAHKAMFCLSITSVLVQVSEMHQVKTTASIVKSNS